MYVYQEIVRKAISSHPTNIQRTHLLAPFSVLTVKTITISDTFKTTPNVVCDLQ